MKKIFALLVLLLIVFVIVERHRLFVRDPLGSVTRNGVKESGAQVFINIDNDVLLENDNPPMYLTLIQQGQPVGTPKVSMCMHWVVCLMDAYPATLVAPDANASITSMTSKTVTYIDAGKHEAVVTLR